MSRRPLSADERALWRRVVADVRPLRDRSVEADPPDAPIDRSVRAASGEAETRPSKTAQPTARPSRLRVSRSLDPPLEANGSSSTLDGSWDKRLARGAVAPDRVIDLHGHTLAAAHATLDAALAHAVADGDRVLLVVAGRVRPEGARGAIRRAVGDWLAASRHAARIAAVRPAHPRHGGGGAFYLILRRQAAPRG